MSKISKNLTINVSGKIKKSKNAKTSSSSKEKLPFLSFYLLCRFYSKCFQTKSKESTPVVVYLDLSISKTGKTLTIDVQENVEKKPVV